MVKFRITLEYNWDFNDEESIIKNLRDRAIDDFESIKIDRMG